MLARGAAGAGHYIAAIGKNPTVRKLAEAVSDSVESRRCGPRTLGAGFDGAPRFKEEPGAG